MEELQKGEDSITCSAKVKVANSEKGKVAVYRRPIQYIFPLELHLQVENELEHDREQVQRAKNQVVKNTVPDTVPEDTGCDKGRTFKNIIDISCDQRRECYRHLRITRLPCSLTHFDSYIVQVLRM